MMALLVSITDLSSNNNIAHMTHELENNSKNGQLSVPSKYLANYIEQRKTLLLAKLSQNGVVQQHMAPQAKRSFAQVGNQQGKTQEKDIVTAAKSSKNNPVKEKDSPQSANKINKKNNPASQTDPYKFLARSNLYERQRQLRIQFQKKKHFYSSSNPTFNAHHQSKRNDCKPQQPAKVASREQEQCGYGARYQKKVKERTDQTLRYKDILKRGEKNAPPKHRKTSSTVEQQRRWVKIQEIFSKMTFSFEEDDFFNKIEEHQRTADEFPRQQQQYIDEEDIFTPIKITLKKTESIQYNDDKMQEMDLKQQFDEQLSGIMVNQDRREELDTSNLIESVVNEMIFENVQRRNSGKQESEHKEEANKEVVQSVSILEEDNKEENNKEEESKEEEKQILLLPEQKVFSKALSIQEHDWLKSEQAENQLELPSPIQIQKVQSQIIENLPQQVYSQHSQCKEIIFPQNQQEPQSPFSALVEPISEQDTSIINQITQQLQIPPNINILQPQSIKMQEAIQQQVKKESLGALAAQFMKIVTIDDQYDSINILDEEQPIIVIDSFPFREITYQKVQAIVSNTLPKPLAEPIPQIHILSPAEQETMDHFQESQQTNQEYIPQFPPRSMSNLKDFGECHFLVIPEESEEESRQSQN